MSPPTTDLTIHHARETECAAILDLWTRAGATPTVTDNLGSLLRLIREHNSLLVAETVILSVPAYSHGSEGSLRYEPSPMEPILLGTVIAGRDGWRGNIYRLAVLPTYRKRGIGRALVAAAERHLAAKGAKRIMTWPDHTHAEADVFWKHMEAGYGYVLDYDARRYFKTLA